MRQVLFRIPIPNPWNPQGIPIYGFGAMLVLALFLGWLVAAWRARRAGIPREHVENVAFWIVISGIVGARIVFMIQYHQPLGDFYKFWEGGLVFYGALVGGAVGYVIAYYRILRKHGIPAWKLADVVAPSIALGLCIGRFGCLLNGCCFGDVACPECASLRFPAHSFSWRPLVENGYQAAAGFTLDENALGAGSTVRDVDASSEAARAGLRPGDVIVKADGQPMPNPAELSDYLLHDTHWQHGGADLALTVKRGGQEIDLPPFRPHTLGLYPTQVYESVSAFLIFLVLLAYTPFRRHDGEVLLLFLTLYPIHRFLNEMLRHDTDPVAFGLTLSQNGSLLILAVALGLWVWMLRKPAQYQPFQHKDAVAVSAA